MPRPSDVIRGLLTNPYPTLLANQIRTAPELVIGHFGIYDFVLARNHNARTVVDGPIPDNTYVITTSALLNEEVVSDAYPFFGYGFPMVQGWDGAPLPRQELGLNPGDPAIVVTSQINACTIVMEIGARQNPPQVSHRRPMPNQGGGGLQQQLQAGIDAQMLYFLPFRQAQAIPILYGRAQYPDGQRVQTLGVRALNGVWTMYFQRVNFASVTQGVDSRELGEPTRSYYYLRGPG